ncbi:MAG: hypothetical protein BWY76_00089 [bacterium ADurb.Bin429]|nr:MAG: hypothetical protein BWY76_00089 [bacterium ADurb.Bin429]
MITRYLLYYGGFRPEPAPRTRTTCFVAAYVFPHPSLAVVARLFCEEERIPWQ